jgi:hypothetical protein
MMRRLYLIFLIPAAFLVCKSPYELVRTGPQNPPLQKEAEVTVVPWTDLDKYDQIAVVDVGEFTLERRIKYAKIAARDAGGEFIAPKLTGDKSKDGTSDFLIQSFVVLKKKPPQETALPKVSAGIAAKDAGSLEAPEEKTAMDGSKLPRASYRMLLTDYASIRGEKFQGSLYPVKFFQVPRELKKEAGTGKNIIMLSSRQGTAKVLLIVPSARRAELNRMIKSKKKYDFIYSPVTVYKSKYPVLELIGERK